MAKSKGGRRRAWGQIRRRGRNYSIRYHAWGREVEEAVGPSKTTAEALLARRRTEIAEQRISGRKPIRPVRFEVFIPRYLESISRTESPETVRGKRPHLKRIGETFRGRRLDEIRAEDVIGFKDALRAHGLSGASVNRYISTLSALFQRARALGHVRENPCRGIRRERESVRAFPYISRGEQARLVEAMPARIRRLVTLALETGLRRGELLRLEWSDVDFPRRRLVVRTSKNGRPREVPLTARALQALRFVPMHPNPRTGDMRIFSGVHASSGHLQTLWKRGVRRAGLAVDLRFHDLRHLFGANAVRAGVPLPDLAKLMGHRSLQATMRYANHSAGDAAERARELLDGGPAGARGGEREARYGTR